jgi:hypothetical protein
VILPHLTGKRRPSDVGHPAFFNGSKSPGGSPNFPLDEPEDDDI